MALLHRISCMHHLDQVLVKEMHSHGPLPAIWFCADAFPIIKHNLLAGKNYVTFNASFVKLHPEDSLLTLIHNLFFSLEFK